MNNPPTDSFPELRRIVTSHDAAGVAIVQSDTYIPAEFMGGMEGVKSAGIWVTTDSIPTNDNNLSEDGRSRVIDNVANFGLVPPNGTNLRSTELAPGVTTPMHRTSSLDFNILVSGELILITEDGTEKHLKNPGDTVVQKGTMHAWKNPSKTWTRWVSVLIAAEPAVANGEVLKPEIK